MATLFTRIIEEEIPSVRIFEDENCIAILDIAPVNKGHILVIARQEYETLIDCPDETLSHLIIIAKKLAARMKERLGCDGFNLMINNGAASGQEVPHLHIHLIPRYSGDGKTPRMTKERYEEDEMVRYGKQLS